MMGYAYNPLAFELGAQAQRSLDHSPGDGSVGSRFIFPVVSLQKPPLQDLYSVSRND